MNDTPKAPVVPVAWRKSTHSGHQGDCVEVAPRTAHLTIRDSKRPAQARLRLPHHAWPEFLAALRHG
ncbi:DUF397 domain-containing protein [Embleya sp. NPDC056575]|uniref:DUF397 domain-containing protein n=1 Tax=unclassified Embleya TaxID=2699296 RepID=UPI00369885E4